MIAGLRINKLYVLWGKPCVV